MVIRLILCLVLLMFLFGACFGIGILVGIIFTLVGYFRAGRLIGKRRLIFGGICIVFDAYSEYDGFRAPFEICETASFIISQRREV